MALKRVIEGLTTLKQHKYLITHFNKGEGTEMQFDIVTTLSNYLFFFFFRRVICRLHPGPPPAGSPG